MPHEDASIITLACVTEIWAGAHSTQGSSERNGRVIINERTPDVPLEKIDT
jgi:hypothetical protein